MKAVKIVVISMACLTAGAVGSRAQDLVCDTILEDSRDTVRIIQTSGLPGDIVEVPVAIKNHRNVASLQIHMEFDPNLIHPVVKSVDTTTQTTVIIDTTIIPGDTIIDTTIIVDEFITYDYKHTLKGIRVDTTTPPAPHPDTPCTGYGTRVVDEIDFPSQTLHRVKIYLLPTDFFAYFCRSAIDSGDGAIMTIPFVIDSGATVGSNTTIGFYRETIYNDSIPPQPVGCVFSQYYDTTGLGTNRLIERPGQVVFQEPPELPIIDTFTASDSSIFEGESVTLKWHVSRATSVEISNIGTVDSVGDTVVSPTSTTTYTLTATNAEGSVNRSIKITVEVAPPNNKPEFTSPTQLAWEIEQGQTMSFPVIATDADNDNLTLSATNLPNNSTFGPTNPVVGVGTVTGNFSFTPDYGQEGTFSVTFTVTDGKPNGTAQLIVTIVVTPIEFDRLFTTSALGQEPMGGLAGTKTVMIPINMVTSQTVYGVQFDLRYDDQYFEIDSIITTPRTPDYVIYDNMGQTPGEVRVVTFGVANDSIVSDTNTAILYVAMSIDSLAPSGNYPLYLEDGWESTNPDPDFPSLPLVTDSGVIQVDYLGDVNLDQRVDVADAVNVVGYVLDNYELSPRQYATANVIVDADVNVLDLVGIINLIFGIPPSPTAGQFLSGVMATVALDYPDLSAGETDIVVVNSELPALIAGVQLEILYDPSTISLGAPTHGEDAAKLIMSHKDNGAGKLTVLLYFRNPDRSEDLIQIGGARLVNVPITAVKDVNSGDVAQMRLSNALLSTPAARPVRVEGIDPLLPATFVLHQNYPNPFNSTTIIEFSLGGAGDGLLTQRVSLDIYNILGQHVKNLIDDDLTLGNYRVEWDATNRGGRRVASGIYLYRLQVDQGNESKKMVLLK